MCNFWRISTDSKYITPYIDITRGNIALEDFVINNSTSNSITGTVTYSASSNVVVGTGTAFNTEIDAGEYVNVDTGKLYVDIYPNSNNRGGNGMGGVYHKSHVLDAGIGMFGKSEDSLVDEIIKLASDTFIL